MAQITYGGKNENFETQNIRLLTQTVGEPRKFVKMILTTSLLKKTLNIPKLWIGTNESNENDAYTS